MASSSRANEESEDLYTCSICYYQYDEGDRKPKFLPCAHTFCLTCLKVMIQDSRTISCPLCKKKCRQGSAEEFPNNLYALQLMKLVSQKQEEMILNWCLTCGTAARLTCEHVHTTVSMLNETDNIKSKMREVRSNLESAISKRQRMSQQLRSTLETLKAKEMATQKLLVRNVEHLDKLRSLMDNSSNHLAPGKQAVDHILKAIDKAVEKSKEELIAAHLFQHELDGSKTVNHLEAVTTSDHHPVAGPSNLMTSQERNPRKRKRSSSSDIRCKATEVHRICFVGNLRDEVTSIHFNPVKPQLACVLNTGHVCLFQGENSASPFTCWALKPFSSLIRSPERRSISWNADGTRLAIGSELAGENVSIWTDVSDTPLKLSCHDCEMLLLRWNPVDPHVFITAGSDMSIVVTNVVERLSRVQTFRCHHQAQILDLEWVSSHTFASCSSDGTIRLFCLGSPDPKRTFLHVNVSCLRWNEDLSLLASCDSKGFIRVWSLDKEQAVHVFGTLQPVKCINWGRCDGVASNGSTRFFLASGSTASSSAGAITIWDPLKMGARTQLTPSPPAPGISSLAFSPNGRFLAAISSHQPFETVTIWLCETWEVIYKKELEVLMQDTQLSWNPYSSKLALSGDIRRVTVIEIE